jgi:hypothetical protein
VAHQSMQAIDSDINLIFSSSLLCKIGQLSDKRQEQR